MKTIYRCEVCGKELADWDECHEHEKTCKEIHATGFRLAEQLNNTVKAANERGNCEVGVCVGCDDTVYRFVYAEYKPRERIVVLDIDTDDSIVIRQRGENNGND